jgi:hypothetical protein
VSALHHEVLAVLRLFSGPRSTWLTAVHVGARRRKRAAAALLFRRVAMVLADLRKRGLVTSFPNPHGAIVEGETRRGHLWSVP